MSERRPTALDYAGLVGRYVVLTTRNADGMSRWSAGGLVAQVADTSVGVSLTFESGLGLLWGAEDVEAGHYLTMEIYPDEATYGAFRGETSEPTCDCPPGLTGGHYLYCPKVANTVEGWPT